MTLPRVFPADLPTYLPTGDGQIMLLAEYARTVTLECDRCTTPAVFKLISDNVLTDHQCDALLDDYLRDIGWQIEAGVEVCPNCR